MRGIVVSFGRAFGCIAAILFLLAAPASAGAMSAAPSGPLWDGFYAGGEVGGAWSKLDWTFTNPNYFNTLGAMLLGSDFSHSASGAIGGAFAGYNFQTGPWVLGVEISAAASSLKRQKPSPFFPTIDTYTSKINWLATATGRVGYAWDRWLVFAKGGWAGADVELTLYDIPLALERIREHGPMAGPSAGASTTGSTIASRSASFIAMSISASTEKASTVRYAAPESVSVRRSSMATSGCNR